MKQELKNGKIVDYGDIVIHTTTTRVSFWDRIRVLFGKPIIVTSRLYCKEDAVNVIASEAETHVPRFAVRPSSGFAMIKGDVITEEAYSTD